MSTSDLLLQDSYLEDAPSEKQTSYGLPFLISAGIHLAILLSVFPHLDSMHLQLQEDEASLVLNLSLEQQELLPITSEPRETQITTSSDADISGVEGISDIADSSPPQEPQPQAPLDLEIPAINTAGNPQTFEVETPVNPESLTDSEPLTDPEPHRNAALDDPNYSGNIFDARVREKLIESQARAKRLASVAKAEPYSYFDSSGSEVIVNGDTCYKGTSLDDFSGTVWSLPYRCPWVKSQSEIMMDNVRTAMRERRPRH